MTGEIGQLALCLALALSLVQAGAGLAGGHTQSTLAMRIASHAALGFAVFIALAFGALVTGFVTSDFSILDVAQNSHTLKPLFYKVTGVWGNHEGSMLLWVLVLAAYTALTVFGQRGGPRLTSAALGVEGLLAVAFLLYILLASNPFLRLDPPPIEGAGLNALLQDPGLSFHPPTLYLGYVGLSATFAYAAAALLTGEVDARWARAARPFLLVAWCALTLGITAGSWWAYYVLGWGGFWFWDPVENASLMPWLVATALLHSSLATERTGAFRSWTLLLAIGAFSLSLIGTFLVRSGVLTSVHSFANDPERGKFILVILLVSIGSALTLFAWRAPKLDSGTAFEPVSRESALLLNNVLLTGAAATVFLGTLYPLFLEAVTGTRISVGPPYFALTFAPLAAVLLILVPFGPRLAWRRANLSSAVHVLAPGLAAALLAAAIALAIAAPRSMVALAAVALAVWVIAASLLDLRGKFRSHGLSIQSLASALAHAGLGVTLLGIAGTAYWKSEALEVVAPGQSITVGGYHLKFDGVTPVAGPNYTADRAAITVSRNGSSIATLEPELRLYPVEGQTVSKTSIRTTGISDLYVALGDKRGNGRWLIRAFVNPLAPFIWLGGALMALGGFAALAARLRFRTTPNVALAPAE
ncbi:MAG TPA: heme lyase CcmF/NrfE family subunit [Rhizomicrobium sp.]|nr:heme lyase CcmF/NrfE family subunit [Rhizomicrobium sp.]